MEYAKKITAAVMGIGPEVAEKIVKERGTTAVLRVYGFAKSYKEEVSAFGGNYKRFVGEFAAKNLLTGDEARSESLILPPVAEMYVAEGTDMASKENAKYKFGLDLTVQENKSSKGGQKFKYGVRTLVKNDFTDPLTELGDSLTTIEDKTDNKKKK